jgi:hypothetical protein
VEPERKSVTRQRFDKHVPEAKNRHGIIHLLGNGSVSTFPLQRINQNNRGTVCDDDLRVYSCRLEVSPVWIVQSFRIRKGVQCVSSDSSFVIRHSGREDTRSPVRNGESLKTVIDCELI